MSNAITVLAQAHISNQSINFIEEVDDYFLDEVLVGYSGSIEVRLGFIDNESPVEFDNLDYNISVSKNGEIVGEADNAGVHYERTSIEYVKAISLPIMPGEVFDINVSYTNAGITVEDSYTLNIPQEITES